MLGNLVAGAVTADDEFFWIAVALVLHGWPLPVKLPGSGRGAEVSGSSHELAIEVLSLGTL
jgi:hypothetical protein